MKIRLTITLLAIFSIYTGQVQAQKPGQRVETARMQYLTSELNLTTEQGERFWPLYNEYQTKRKSLGLKAHSARLLLSDPSITDEEARANIQNLLVYREKEVQLQREYLPKFEKVISMKQIAKLLNAEQKFVRMLLQRGKHRGDGQVEE